MTDKEKLKEIMKLADAMYYAAFNLTTDASRLKKAMNEYRQFIINEYCKEEPVSEELEDASRNYADDEEYGDDIYFAIKAAFKAGAKWQKEHLRTVGNRTMSRAEKFISEHTRNCSNVFVNPQLGGTEENHPWLTPDQARKAVEIAREEIYDWLEENAANFVCLADDEHIPIGDTKAFYGTKSLIHYLKQAMKDE